MRRIGVVLTPYYAHPQPVYDDGVYIKFQDTSIPYLDSETRDRAIDRLSDVVERQGKELQIFTPAPSLSAPMQALESLRHTVQDARHPFLEGLDLCPTPFSIDS